MRVGIIRSDIHKIFLNDIESRSQRCFSLEPQGQSMYLHKPSDDELLALLVKFAFVSSRSTDIAAAVNTTVNNVLRVRNAATSAWTDITVTANAALAKTAICTELNAAFAAAKLTLHARILGTNQVQIDTTFGGPSAGLYIDSVVGGSTLSTAVGFPVGGVAITGLSPAALTTAVYPTPVTINVAPATIAALSTFVSMDMAELESLQVAIADTIAPHVIETGMALLSFAYGNMSKMRSASFQPGGARSGLPAGACAAIVQDDGNTPFQI